MTKTEAKKIALNWIIDDLEQKLDNGYLEEDTEEAKVLKALIGKKEYTYYKRLEK